MSKTKFYDHKRTRSKGFTLIEILITITILAVLATLSFVALNPIQQIAKARDTKRILNITTLSKAIQIYHLETSTYPGTNDVIRASNLPINGQPVNQITFGWLGVNMSSYINSMPLDPINSYPFVYRYTNSGSDFEIDTQLEITTNQKLVEDGGNNSLKFELGTNLNLLN
jgi:prepilin-type N-terminal cleavage/methylation domain-containing protein